MGKNTKCISIFFQSFRVQVTLRQEYNDPRLEFASTGSNLSHVSLLGEEVDTIWQPDTFVRNERKVIFHESLRPNKYARVFNDGNVLMSQRVTFILSCPDLAKGIATSKVDCPFTLASCKYNAGTLKSPFSE